jgi:hypothetical protein
VPSFIPSDQTPVFCDLGQAPIPRSGVPSRPCGSVPGWGRLHCRAGASTWRGRGQINIEGRRREAGDCDQGSWSKRVICTCLCGSVEDSPTQKIGAPMEGAGPRCPLNSSLGRSALSTTPLPPSVHLHPLLSRAWGQVSLVPFPPSSLLALAV